MFLQEENGGESCIKIAAVLQHKYTLVLVETEKIAHSQSNAITLAVTIFLSGLTGSELYLFKTVSQSGEH